MADDDLGQRIGDYIVMEKLGCGGFGCVYKARHSRLPNRIVAIKVFLGNMDIQREREQFLREARLLDQLRHPCILSILDVDIQEHLFGRDIAYLITEFAPNGSLRDRLDRARSPMALEKVFELLSKIGEGLSYAHAHDVVHRDLKPENILFTAKGDPLLADFGIAIVLASGTRTGDRFGTPAYMAPEQFEGVNSRRSDQYALACVAYELLTGQHPFAGFEGAALMYQQMNVRPKRPRLLNPSLPSTVEDALLRALEKNREDRYPDVLSFLIALRRVPPQPVRPVPSLRESSWRDDEWEQNQPSDPLIRRNRGARSWERGDLPEQVIVRRRRLSPSLVRGQGPLIIPPPVDRSPRLRRFTDSPHSRVRRLMSPPLPLPQEGQRDWPLILYGLVGWVLVGLVLIVLSVFPHIATPWFLFFLLLLTLGGMSLLFCVVQALVSSYRAREWQWFACLLLPPLGFGLFGLFLGLIGGFAVGLVSGIVFSTAVSMRYGWHHVREEDWSLFRADDR